MSDDQSQLPNLGLFPLISPIRADMMQTERQQQILERLRRDGRVLAVDLVEAFGASEDTVRRDLRDLAGRGLCRRVYRGALPISPTSGPAHIRAVEGVERKAALGAALAELVAPRQLVFIDAGSTNLQAARALPVGINVTIATHDPAIAAALSGRTDVDLWLIGGRVDPHVGAALGGRALREIEAMRPDLVLLGVCAIDPTEGVAAFRAEDADIKRALAEKAGAIAAAVINEKLGAGAPFVIGPVEILHRIVLEADAPETLAQQIAARGILVRRAAAVDPKGDPGVSRTQADRGGRPTTTPTAERAHD